MKHLTMDNLKSFSSERVDIDLKRRKDQENVYTTRHQLNLTSSDDEMKVDELFEKIREVCKKRDEGGNNKYAVIVFGDLIHHSGKGVEFVQNLLTALSDVFSSSNCFAYYFTLSDEMLNDSCIYEEVTDMFKRYLEVEKIIFIPNCLYEDNGVKFGILPNMKQYATIYTYDIGE